jgi:CheY-like chemotaxis protein
MHRIFILSDISACLTNRLLASCPAVTVVVVDDDDGVREAIAEVLTLDGYVVHTTGDGDEALRLLASAPRPCVAIVDLLMPRINGWELMRAIAADAALSDIAVICCTAGRDEPPPGCHAVLRKPFSSDELERSVRALFARVSG